jgi:hypothetical protein
MGIWKARLMALLSMVAMLVAFSAPVALADSDCELRERGDDPDRVVCDGERFTVPQFVNEAELDNDDDDCDDFLFDCDDDDDNDLGEAFLFPFFIEEIDVDCDGIDDDEDGEIDEGAECEFEVELFGGEEFEFSADVEDVF